MAKDNKPKFGSRSEDYTPPKAFDPEDVWIKNFQEGDTKIRFLEPTVDFWAYREHFDPGVRRSFPCTGDTNSCVGCRSDVERVRRASGKWAFNALDEQGRLNLYKIGTGLNQLLQKREQRHGTILDRDYIIIRSGTTMENTTYMFEYLDPSDCDYKGELIDIEDVLVKQYEEACELYGGGDVAQAAPEHDTPVTSIRGKAKAKTTVDEAFENAEPIEDWPTSRLKAYLDANEVEFPDRGTRPLLIDLVKSHMQEASGF